MKLAVGSLALAGAAGGGLWFVMGSCHIDTEVTKPHEQRDLQAHEIRAMLAGSDFKRMLEAGQQIDKLAPAEKLRVLLTLAKDPDAAVRLFAAKKLKSVDDPLAKETLARLAKDDPDPTVREIAGTPE